MATQKQKTGEKETQAVGKKSKIAAKEDRQVIVREEILKAKGNIEEGYLDLSRFLSEAYHKEYYQEAWGFQTFEEYCKVELDVAYRKAMYLVEIWDKVKTLNIPKERLAKLGWTKMKDLAAVITEENYKEWLSRAEKMTTRELTDAVKTVRRPDAAKTPTTTIMKIVMSSAEASTINDAIEEAKKLCETESVAVALEMICQDWMAEKGGVPQKTPLSDMIKYLQKTYGVKISYEQTKAAKKEKPSAEATAKKTEEIIKKASKKTESAKKKGKNDIDDLDDDEKPARRGGAKGADIDELLGLPKGA
jgi:hypothetical protein